MRAGPLRQRLTVELLKESTDSYGQRIQSWVPAGTYYASVIQPGGREAVNAKQVRAEMTHQIVMRCIGTVLPPRGLEATARLVLVNPPYAPQIFNILDINNVDNRGREYRITAQELVTPAPGGAPAAGTRPVGTR